ncbi:hypothetical protein BU17DRAFT_96547 [Hysterangium stoloniferum]|nr:hypothetical protein BU17DRAFT_96547 [Hysterangium stoloniferum]
MVNSTPSNKTKLNESSSTNNNDRDPRRRRVSMPITDNLHPPASNSLHQNAAVNPQEPSSVLQTVFRDAFRPQAQAGAATGMRGPTVQHPPRARSLQPKVAGAAMKVSSVRAPLHSTRSLPGRVGGTLQPTVSNQKGARQSQRVNSCIRGSVPANTTADTSAHRLTPSNANRTAPSLQAFKPPENVPPPRLPSGAAASRAKIPLTAVANENTTRQSTVHPNLPRPAPLSNSPASSHARLAPAASGPSSPILPPGAQNAFKLIRNICALSKGRHQAFLSALKTIERTSYDDTPITILKNAYKAAHSVMVSEGAEPTVDAKDLFRTLLSLYTTMERESRDLQAHIRESRPVAPLPTRTHDRERSRSPRRGQNSSRRRSRTPPGARVLSTDIDRDLPQSPPPPYSEFAPVGHKTVREGSVEGICNPHANPAVRDALLTSQSRDRRSNAMESHDERELSPSSPTRPISDAARPRADFSGGGLRFSVSRVARDITDPARSGQARGVAGVPPSQREGGDVNPPSTRSIRTVVEQRLAMMGFTSQTHPALGGIIHTVLARRASSKRLTMEDVLPSILDELA